MNRLLLSFTLALGISALGLLPASARINLVTLPDRDSVQLTIYNSADLTLVEETRILTLRRGLNHLEFSWANTLIDPTSVEFRALTHADEVEVLDVRFPPRVTNTLEWRVQSEFAGEVQIEIRYFTSGIKWSADYLAEAARNEQFMNLAGNVRVTNNSGEDYENAQIRLVVGVIKLVEEIAQLAQAGRPEDLSQPKPEPLREELEARGRLRMQRGIAMAGELQKLKEIEKEAISEYFLYTVEGRDTIPNGWSKRLPSFRTEQVPIASLYKFEREQFGPRAIRFYRFTNSIPAKLGKEPLPDGSVQAFRLVSDDNLYSYVGSTRVKYIPINEAIDLQLGPDQEVRVAPTLQSWQKTDIDFDRNENVAGSTVTEEWRIELQNSKSINILVDVRRHFSGDWSLETTADYEKVDANKVKFLVPLQPGEKESIHYTLTTRYGTNVRK